MPNIAAKPARRPPLTVRPRMKAMSGPGARFSRTAALRKVVQWRRE